DRWYLRYAGAGDQLPVPDLATETALVHDLLLGADAHRHWDHHGSDDLQFDDALPGAGVRPGLDASCSCGSDATAGDETPRVRARQDPTADSCTAEGAGNGGRSLRERESHAGK